MDSINSSIDAVVSLSPGEKPSSGNRCGHDPERPRFFAPPPQHANRPKILQRIIAEIRRYFDDPSALPTLNAANGSDRQQRSERREACCSLLQALMHYTDLITLRVGIPQRDGSMAGIPMASKLLEDGTKIIGLAERAGLSERRAERAVHDLVAAGILSIHPICKKLEDATYQGFAAIRAISHHLFSALGLGQWLAHERRKAKERQQARYTKAKKRQLIEMGRALLGTTPALNAKGKAGQQQPEAAGGPTSASSVAEAHLAAMREALAAMGIKTPKPDTS